MSGSAALRVLRDLRCIAAGLNLIIEMACLQTAMMT